MVFLVSFCGSHCFNSIKNMKDFTQLKTIMDEQWISGDDQNVVKDFLRYFPFRKRQQLLSILIGFPEELSVFIDLLKKKKMLTKNFDASRAHEIISIEREKIDGLMKQI